MLLVRLALCLPFALSFQQSASPAPQASAPAAAKRHICEQVAIIGASLSEGYEAPPGWGPAFEASLARDGRVATNLASSLVFLDPGQMALPQASAALAEKPSLVLAVDYLFWFGYGDKDLAHAPITKEEQRLEMLEKGLESLALFECPVVVGDFPDMSATVGKMLAPSSMPARETLAQLNQRVQAWAAPRKNVVVIGLAEWVAAIGAGREIVIGKSKYAAETTKTWIQGDQLHPTLEGLAALATLVHHELAARKLETPADFVADAAAVRERIAVPVAGEASAPVK